MYGIEFDGHPGLRHLYLPGEFEGFPLRKDFPLLARRSSRGPGLVDVEGLPGEPTEAAEPSGGATAERRATTTSTVTDRQQAGVHRRRRRPTPASTSSSRPRA